MKDIQVHGFIDDDSVGLLACDIESELNEISSKIKDCGNPKYEFLRKEQIANIQQKKFGKHDFRWVISRLNYYAIGAKIMTYINKLKYKKAF